jgi:hypothetical protein
MWVVGVFGFLTGLAINALPKVVSEWIMLIYAGISRLRSD